MFTQIYTELTNDQKRNSEMRGICVARRVTRKMLLECVTAGCTLITNGFTPRKTIPMVFKRDLKDVSLHPGARPDSFLDLFAGYLSKFAQNFEIQNQIQNVNFITQFYCSCELRKAINRFGKAFTLQKIELQRVYWYCQIGSLGNVPV